MKLIKSKKKYSIRIHKQISKPSIFYIDYHLLTTTDMFITASHKSYLTTLRNVSHPRNKFKSRSETLNNEKLNVIKQYEVCGYHNVSVSQLAPTIRIHVVIVFWYLQSNQFGNNKCNLCW